MKKNQDYPSAIIDALQKLGPSAPRVLLDETGGSEKKLGYHLRKMCAAKQVKATGKSKARVYALPGQRLRAAAGDVRSAPAAPRAEALPAIALASKTADGRIVLCFAGRAEAPIVLAPQFYTPLAELLAADEIPF